MSRDVAQAVRNRLLARARRDGEDFQRLLVRFAIERMLYRLSVSPHADAFVLKGATLFAIWMGTPHRATKDLDLLASGAPTVERFVGVFRELASMEIEDDGVRFGRDAVTGRPIREDANYAGVRVTVPGELAGARFKLQIDIGLGDAVVPPARSAEMPSLLDLPAPVLAMYPPETVVAEKLEALVVLGLTTSRMKDLYDLDLIRQTFAFDGTLVEAVRATFARRGTAVPSAVPTGLSEDFARDEIKLTQWKAFVRKSVDGQGRELAEVVADLRSWLWPVLQAVAEGVE